MRAHYGPGWPGCSSSNKVPIDFCGKTLLVHKAAAKAFIALGQEFERRAPKYAAKIRSRPDTGSYVCRPISGTSTPSNHSFGTAVDVVWQENGRDGDGTFLDSSIWHEARSVIFWAEKHGFRWGGRYSEPDPMHFEMVWTPAQVDANFKAREWDEMASKQEIKDAVREVVKDEMAKVKADLMAESVRTYRKLSHGDETTAGDSSSNVQHGIDKTDEVLTRMDELEESV